MKLFTSPSALSHVASVAVGISLALSAQGSTPDLWIQRVTENLKKLEEGASKNSAIGYSVNVLLELGHTAEGLKLAKVLRRDPSLYLQAVAGGLGARGRRVALPDSLVEDVVLCYSQIGGLVDERRRSILEKAAAFQEANPERDIQAQVDTEVAKLGNYLSRALAAVWVIQQRAGVPLSPSPSEEIKVVESFSAAMLSLADLSLLPRLMEWGGSAELRVGLREELLKSRIESLATLKEFLELTNREDDPTFLGLIEQGRMLIKVAQLGSEAFELGQNEVGASLRGRCEAMSELFDHETYQKVSLLERELSGTSPERELEKLRNQPRQVSKDQPIDDPWIAADFLDQRLRQTNVTSLGAEDWNQISKHLRSPSPVVDRIQKAVFGLSPEALETLATQDRSTGLGAGSDAYLNHWLGCWVAVKRARMNQDEQARETLKRVQRSSRDVVEQMNQMKGEHQAKLAAIQKYFSEGGVEGLPPEEIEIRNQRKARRIQQETNLYGRELTELSDLFAFESEVIALTAIGELSEAQALADTLPKVSATDRMTLVASGLVLAGRFDELEALYAGEVNSAASAAFALGALAGFQYSE